jgi:uncharacterized protein DUF3667
MSKGKIREDKTCLNCGTIVEERFCPQCGQENTETRKSFHYLFTHFVEDLVHYDSGFWKTMKYLLFYPAKLTREYLSGRRQRYVVPVKLYIFISFVTFFISSFFFPELNTHNNESKKTSFKVTTSTNKPKAGVWYSNDTVPKNSIVTIDKEDLNWFTKYKNNYGWAGDCKTVKAFDSIQNSLPENKKSSKINYWIQKRIIRLAEHNTLIQAFDKLYYRIKQDLPKVLFLYMPFFAFSLWLIHGKKRWYYFDHGIFTLHYFSFLLLTTSLFIIVEEILDFGNNTFINILLGLIRTGYFLWIIIYFYKAHKRFYGEGAFVSFIKSSMLFFINYVMMLIVMIAFILYSALSIR